MNRRSHKLTDEHKAFLVTRYASYGRGHEIINEFEQEFGFRPMADVVRKYNLAGVRDEADAKKRGMFRWMPLWKKAREEFEASVGDIPIANAVYRVKKLDEMFDAAFQKKNYKTAAQLLEQAAKETGGMFTNRREVTGKVDVSIEEVPDEIKNASLAERLRAEVLAAVNAAAAGVQEPAKPAAPTKH